MRSLDLSHCQRMIVHPKVRVLRCKATASAAVQQSRTECSMPLRARAMHVSSSPTLGLQDCCGTSCERTRVWQYNSLWGRVRAFTQNVIVSLALQQNELRLQSSLTDGGLAFLAPLKHLRTLSLKNCVMLEGSGLRHITGLSLLRTLDLTGCARLTNKGEPGYMRMHKDGRRLRHITGLSLLRARQTSPVAPASSTTGCHAQTARRGCST